MPGIVLVDAVGEELFSGASILSSRRSLALVVEDDEPVADVDPPPAELHEVEEIECLDAADLCPETIRSGVFARTSRERAIDVHVDW